VPRFYGFPADIIFASTLSIDEARLATARSFGLPSWTVLLERIKTVDRPRPGDLALNPWQQAAKAIEASNLDELQRITAAHPELLAQTDEDYAIGRSVLGTALHHERRQGAAALAPIIAWLVSEGFDVQRELNRMLCGRMRMKTEDVPWLLERGADPDALAPNGITVLEHAIIRYWNGEAVDLVAARAHPRQALWIAAGLGDVDGVARFLDAQGKPTVEARRDRPHFDAINPAGMLPPLPEADDEEVLMEAFLVAVLNSRTAVLEYLVSRGFPVDSLFWGSPMVAFAAGNGFTRVVECLVRCGANVDLHGWGDMQTARGMAREVLEQLPQDSDRRRIAELCGLDPDTVLRERNARPLPPPEIEPRLKEALELAGDDAARLGQSDIRPENLLFGLLRINNSLPLVFFTEVSKMNIERFRADYGVRVRSSQDRLERTALPLHAEALAAVQAAIAAATQRRREGVGPHHLLYALLRTDHGVAADLLARYGANAATLSAEMERSL
jgi:hypothetical protein